MPENTERDIIDLVEAAIINFERVHFEDLKVDDSGVLRLVVDGETWFVNVYQEVDEPTDLTPLDPPVNHEALRAASDVLADSDFVPLHEQMAEITASVAQSFGVPPQLLGVGPNQPISRLSAFVKSAVTNWLQTRNAREVDHSSPELTHNERRALLKILGLDAKIGCNHQHDDGRDAVEFPDDEADGICAICGDDSFPQHDEYAEMEEEMGIGPAGFVACPTCHRGYHIRLTFGEVLPGDGLLEHENCRLERELAEAGAVIKDLSDALAAHNFAQSFPEGDEREDYIWCPVCMAVQKGKGRIATGKWVAHAPMKHDAICVVANAQGAKKRLLELITERHTRSAVLLALGAAELVRDEDSAGVADAFKSGVNAAAAAISKGMAKPEEIPRDPALLAIRECGHRSLTQWRAAAEAVHRGQALVAAYRAGDIPDEVDTLGAAYDRLMGILEDILPRESLDFAVELARLGVNTDVRNVTRWRNAKVISPIDWISGAVPLVAEGATHLVVQRLHSLATSGGGFLVVKDRGAYRKISAPAEDQARFVDRFFPTDR